MEPADRQVNGVPKAYSLAALTRDRVLNDRIGKTPVVVVATRGRVSVAGRSRRAGPVTYDAGGEVRAYARGGEQFRPASGPAVVMDAAGRQWRVAEDALVGPAGQRARRLGGHLAYWFGWYSFFPNSRLYR